MDAVESHQKFAEKNHLNFPLISDYDKQISKTYGVLSKDGSRAERMTFIIDKESKIAKMLTNVNITKHTHEIVAVLTTSAQEDELKKNPRHPSTSPSSSDYLCVDLIVRTTTSTFNNNVTMSIASK